MIAILYASQSGTSRSIAHLIKKSIDFGFNKNTIYDVDNEYLCRKTTEYDTVICEIDSFDIKDVFAASLIVFVVPTYGDGDEPFNMRNFWLFLRNKNLPQDIFSDTKFCIFGLGDSNYEKFNYCAKKLYNRLLSLGARSVVTPGYGDSQDDGGYLKLLGNWVENLFYFLNDHYEPSNRLKKSFDKVSNIYTSKLTLYIDFRKRNIFYIQIKGICKIIRVIFSTNKNSIAYKDYMKYKHKGFTDLIPDSQKNQFRDSELLKDFYQRSGDVSCHSARNEENNDFLSNLNKEQPPNSYIKVCEYEKNSCINELYKHILFIKNNLETVDLDVLQTENIQKMILQSLTNEGVESKENWVEYTLCYKETIPECDYSKKIIKCGLKSKSLHDFFPGDCIAFKPSNYNAEDFINHNKAFLFNNVFWVNIHDQNILEMIDIGKSENCNIKTSGLIGADKKKEDRFDNNICNIDETFSKEEISQEKVSELKFYNKKEKNNFFNNKPNDKNNLEEEICDFNNDIYGLKRVIIEDQADSNNNIRCMRMIFIKNFLDLIVGEFIEKVFDFNFLPNQHIFLHLEKYLITFPTHISLLHSIRFEQVIGRLRNIYEDYDVYYDYIVKPKRTFFEVITELGIRINFNFVLAHIPEIQPRYFTTAKIEDEYQIYVSLVNFQTNIVRPRLGLCSEYLKNTLKPTMKVCIRFGKSNLYFTKDYFLFFVTGTGIVLPWSVVNFFQKKKVVIFYGFRQITKDRLLNDELPCGTHENNRNIVTVYEAASQEAPSRHIQDVFDQSLLENIDMYDIFVCGNTTLNKSVRKILSKHYGKSISFQSETW